MFRGTLRKEGQACSGLLTPNRQPVGSMLVAGGLCRHELLRDGASPGAGKVHPLLRVPPTDWRKGSKSSGNRLAGRVWDRNQAEFVPVLFRSLFRSFGGAGQAVIQMAVRKLRSQVHWRFANWRVRCCVRRIAAARPIRPARKSIASA